MSNLKPLAIVSIQRDNHSALMLLSQRLQLASLSLFPRLCLCASNYAFIVLSGAPGTSFAQQFLRRFFISLITENHLLIGKLVCRPFWHTRDRMELCYLKRTQCTSAPHRHAPHIQRLILFHIQRLILFHIQRLILFHIQRLILFHIQRLILFHIQRLILFHIQRLLFLILLFCSKLPQAFLLDYPGFLCIHAMDWLFLYPCPPRSLLAASKVGLMSEELK